jgi:hypothetical protein
MEFPTSTAITTDCSQPSRLPPDDAGLLSNALPPPRRWEYVGATMLFLTPPASFCVCHFARTGRDLTMPFLIVNGIVLLAAMGIGVFGFLRGNCSHYLAGGAICLIAFSVGYGATNTYLLGVLGKECTISITTIDELTGKPIPNAKVTLSYFSTQPRTENSDKNGQCEIPFTFRGTERESPVCRTGRVLLASVSVETDAAGYVATKQDLGDLIQSVWPLDGPPPPPLVMRLRPIR